VSDPSWASVSLLLHCDGSDGSTTFVDSGPLGLSVIAESAAVIRTALPKFGSASASLIEGAYGALRVNANAAFAFGTGDFTIEGWVYTDAWGGEWRSLCSLGNDYDTANLYLGTADSGAALAWYMGGAQRIVHQTNWGTGGAQWRHFALVRSGNVFRLYWDGVQSTASYTTTASMPSGQPLLIGMSNTSFDDVVKARIDEIRLTKEARYTATFTPPTAAFPEGSGSSGSARVLGASALGRGAARVLAPHDVRVRGSSALGIGRAQVGRSEVRVSASTAMGRGAAVSVNASVRARAGSAIGSVSALAANRSARVAGRSALGAGQSFVNSPRLAWGKGGSALGTAKVRIYNDFTGAVDPASPLVYVADMVTPTGVVRVPISSWQATLQLDSSCYGQAVLPAAFELADAIGTATEVIILRQARLSAGGTVEQMMLRFPVETRSLARGARNYTATLAGYFDAFPGESNLPDNLTRSLQGVRSVTEDGGGIRIRADVDWLLRPGMSARYGATELNVSFINYYVPGNDQFMDIGERA
jgi:hypothetical protein